MLPSGFPMRRQMRPNRALCESRGSQALLVQPIGFHTCPRASVQENMVKPHGKLVLVSSVSCPTYTSSLSTWFSPRYLQGD